MGLDQYQYAEMHVNVGLRLAEPLRIHLNWCDPMVALARQATRKDLCAGTTQRPVLCQCVVSCSCLWSAIRLGLEPRAYTLAV